MIPALTAVFLAAAPSLLVAANPLREKSFKLDVFRHERRQEADPSATPATSSTGGFGYLEATPQPQPIANKNRFWITSIDVGSPPQTMNITIDTGSGGLWFRAGHDIPPELQNAYHAVFDPTASSTFVNNTDEPFNADVAGVTGNYAQDTINIGGINIPNARFGLVGPANDDSDTDGIMGMSPIQKVTDYTDPWTGTLPNYLEDPVMTANLPYNDSGCFGFGKIDPSELGGPINWNTVNIAPSSAWLIDTMYMSANGVPLNGGAASTTILDTDGNGIEHDLPFVTDYYSRISGAVDQSNGAGTSWTVPCDTQMPDIEFTWNNASQQTGVISGQYLIDPPSFDGEPDCTTHFSAGGNNFGAPFFQSNWVAFWFPLPPAQQWVGVAPRGDGSADGITDSLSPPS